MPFVFPVGLVFWAVFFWSFGREQKIINRAFKTEIKQTAHDKGSLRVIAFGQFIGLFAAFWFAFRAPLYDLPRLPSYLAGIALMIAGALFRRHCFRMLGTSFTGAVTARADQPVVDRGAYRWIRHPSYVAGTIMVVGLGVALGNALSASSLALVCAIVYGYRVRVEERALLGSIGEPYRAYMARTRRFIPYVF